MNALLAFHKRTKPQHNPSFGQILQHPKPVVISEATSTVTAAASTVKPSRNCSRSLCPRGPRIGVCRDAERVQTNRRKSAGRTTGNAEGLKGKKAAAGKSRSRS